MVIRENSEEGRRWEKDRTQTKNRQEQIKVRKGEERKRDNNYYTQFNVKEEEINKEHYGMALRRTTGSWTVYRRKTKNIDKMERKEMEMLWKKLIYYIERTTSLEIWYT